MRSPITPITQNQNKAKVAKPTTTRKIRSPPEKHGHHIPMPLPLSLPLFLSFMINPVFQ
jgi:hypothetical protein